MENHYFVMGKFDGEFDFDFLWEPYVIEIKIDINDAIQCCTNCSHPGMCACMLVCVVQNCFLSFSYCLFFYFFNRIWRSYSNRFWNWSLFIEYVVSYNLEWYNQNMRRKCLSTTLRYSEFIPYFPYHYYCTDYRIRVITARDILKNISY